MTYCSDSSGIKGTGESVLWVVRQDLGGETTDERGRVGGVACREREREGRSTTACYPALNKALKIAE